MARDNPAGGYRRICAELTGLGHTIASPATREILKEAGIDPAPQRAAASWGQFLSAQAKTIAAVDFFHAGTVLITTPPAGRTGPIARPPDGRSHVPPADDNFRVRRHDRLGDLLHEYSQAA